MKALVYRGPGRRSRREAPDPRIQHATDPGTVTAVGSAVGRREQRLDGGGWILGRLIDGIQASTEISRNDR